MIVDPEKYPIRRPDHVEWVERNVFDRKLSHVEAVLVDLLCAALGVGPWNVREWATLQAAGDRAATVLLRPMYGGLATFDSDQLTHLVLEAHERCVRVSIAAPDVERFRSEYAELLKYTDDSGRRRTPVTPPVGALVVVASLREREGSISRRHPTIEQVIAMRAACRGGAS